MFFMKTDLTSGLDSLPSWGMVVVICIIIAGLTEVTSNVATANILLPVLAEVAVATETNPLYLMIPATVTCSYAFMLPVATPPNAIAHEASGMSTTQMMKVKYFCTIDQVSRDIISGWVHVEHRVCDHQHGGHQHLWCRHVRPQHLP